VAYSRRLQLELLQETTDEMARNGCKKIIIANGHGGNNSLLPYFAQTQLDTPHDYVVYVVGIMRSGLSGRSRPTRRACGYRMSSTSGASVRSRRRSSTPLGSEDQASRRFSPWGLFCAWSEVLTAEMTPSR